MSSYQITPRVFLLEALTLGRPMALAWVADNKRNPKTSGLVRFYEPSNGGVLVEAEFFGLPDYETPSNSGFFAMHIHNLGDCGNNFMNTGGHFNPTNQMHPYHVGDMPPLLSNQGYAWTAFFDRRFTIDEIIGKSVAVHSGADDFKTQPSGASGKIIACGDIRRNY